MSAHATDNYFALAALPRARYTHIVATDEDYDETDRQSSMPTGRKSKAPTAAADLNGAAPATSRLERFRRTHLLTAWRLMLGSGALAGVCVLLINLVTFIVIYARYEIIDYTATIWTGNCTTTARTVTCLHLFINVLSSILLASSNFSMQCLSSPTRDEVDRAHASHKWLSIGTPNVRNLFWISKTKALLWLLLGVSSFPLHLLWNSTVFETLATNEYVAVSVTPSFLTGGSWSLAHPAAGGNASSSLAPSLTESVQLLQGLAMNSSLERLDNADCIRAYGQQFQEKRRNLLMVVNYNNASDSTSALALYFNRFSPDFSTTFGWMCNSDVVQTEDGGVWACDAQYLSQFASENSNQWIPGGSSLFNEIGDTNINYPEQYHLGPDCGGDDMALYCGDQRNATVQYCLSQTVTEQCKVSVVPLFLVVVVVCNVLKIVGFIWTLYITQRQPPLITTGDAIQSFIRSPDTTTRHRCLVEKIDYDSLFHRSRHWSDALNDSVFVSIWTSHRWRWGKAVRARYWWALFLTAGTGMILVGAFYGPGGLGDGTTETWPLVLSLGIGQPQTNFTLSFGNVPLLTAFLSANAAQVVVSYAYLALNNLCTTMLAMREWTSYGQSGRPAKGLRVTKPNKETISEQRSTYFLSLPLRWAVPGIILFMLLHWLFSQLIFLARVEVYSPNGQLNVEDSITTVYFSPLAMLLAVSVGSSLLIAVVALAVFKKYPAVPLAGCCSASISAACQPRHGHDRFEEGLELRKLRWGVTDVPRGVAEVGHATFHDGVVGRLVTGCLYA